MITFKRKATLNWVMDPTAFQAINQTALVVVTRPLGTGVGAVNKMLACAEEMEMLLPEILGISPNSNSTDWQSKLSLYWHNFGLDVPQTGHDFDCSMVFDMSDHKRKGYINELIAQLGLNKTKDADTKLTGSDLEKKLFSYITGDKVSETERYRYMSPVNVEQYLAWRYCLVSSKVANTPDVIKNSTNIDFYLLDEATLIANRNKANKLKSDAIEAYYNLVKDSEASNKVINILIADEQVTSLEDIKKLSENDGDAGALVLEMATLNPEKLLGYIADTNVTDKAEIKKWELAGFVRKLPNTTIYVDASDPSVILGNTIDDVVGYINAEVNAAYVNVLRLKFKNINN